MALLGILSFFQITLLPGALLLAVANYRGPLLRRTLLSFGLSLLANYLGVFALTAAGLYRRPVVLGIFGAELVALAWLRGAAVRRWLSAPLLSSILDRTAAEVRRLRQLMDGGVASFVRERGLGRFVSEIAVTAVLVVALVQIALVLVTFAGNWGTIFTWWDAVVSWNRWAVDWSHNTLPIQTWHYPQLLPANWSISYVFMNAPLQYVAKGMMPIFMLALLLAMVDLGWTRRTAGFYVAPLVAVFLFRHCGISTTEGIADLAVSCMVFLSFSCVLATVGESGAGSRTRYLAIGAVLAAGAAVTKQTGLYFLPVYAVLAYGLAASEQSTIGAARALRLAAVYVAIVLAVVVPFYVHAEMRIHTGLNASEIAWVTQGIFQGTPVPQRLVNAARLFIDSMGRTPTLLMLLLCLASLGDRLSRWTIGLILVPYGLLWAAFASYDLRNLGLALPFLAMSVGTGAVAVGRALLVSPVPTWRRGVRRLSEVHASVIVAAAVVLMAVGIAFGLNPTDERLVAHHVRLQWELGNAALNAQLSAQHNKQPFSRLIVTNYPFLLHLPGLTHLYLEQTFMGNPPEPIEFARYQTNLADPRVGYFLMPSGAYPSIMRDVEERLQRGDLKLLFRAEGYLCVEIVR